MFEFQEVSQPFRLSLVSPLPLIVAFRILLAAVFWQVSLAEYSVAHAILNSNRKETFPARQGRYQPPTPMVMGILVDD